MVEVVPIKPVVDAEVVGRLEELLTEARAGRLSFIAYTAQRPTGRFTTGWRGTCSSRMEMIGQLSHLQHRLHAAIDAEPDAE